jgi:hypothetical protein
MGPLSSALPAPAGYRDGPCEGRPAEASQGPDALSAPGGRSGGSELVLGVGIRALLG